ncbi:uncharacterized protein DS421_6g197320 [Arachis hypogaea]|nr:uncharacterized protein DS421_6g197320 [Arachis hypogaea]
MEAAKIKRKERKGEKRMGRAERRKEEGDGAVGVTAIVAVAVGRRKRRYEREGDRAAAAAQLRRRHPVELSLNHRTRETRRKTPSPRHASPPTCLEAAITSQI